MAEYYTPGFPFTSQITRDYEKYPFFGTITL